MPAFTSIAIAATAASAAVGVASFVQQSHAQKKQQAAFEEQAAAQKEANRVSTNAQRATDRATRRRVAREERRRRATLLSSSATSGGLGSSGLAGAGSAIGSSFGEVRGTLREQAFTSRSISTLNQEAADAATRAGVAAFEQKQAAVRGSFYQDLLSIGMDFAESPAGKDLLSRIQ